MSENSDMFIIEQTSVLDLTYPNWPRKDWCLILLLRNEQWVSEWKWLYLQATQKWNRYQIESIYQMWKDDNKFDTEFQKSLHINWTGLMIASNHKIYDWTNLI